MKLQYLGTAAAEGIPGIFCRCELCATALKQKGKDIRTRSQAVIDDCLVIDFPPDSYAHMLTHNLDLPNIEHIIFTHSHQDHCYELDFAMRTQYFADDVTVPLHLYGNSTVDSRFNIAIEDSDLPKDCNLEERLIFHKLTPFKPIQILDYTVTPLLARHDPKETCLIFFIEKDGKSILYANDTGIFPDETWDFLKGKKIDLLSMDCTLAKHKEGTNHMGIPDNIDTYNRLASMKCVNNDTTTVITHFSHHGDMLHADLETAVKEVGFLVAYDGMSVDF